jgi:hypothetical protein
MMTKKVEEEQTLLMVKGVEEEQTLLMAKGVDEEQTLLMVRGVEEDHTLLMEKGVEEDQTLMMEKGVEEEQTVLMAKEMEVDKKFPWTEVKVNQILSTTECMEKMVADQILFQKTGESEVRTNVMMDQKCHTEKKGTGQETD